MAIPSASEKRPKREMQVLIMGLPRTGSASMARALEILGYEDVYHGLKGIDRTQDWDFFDAACDATFPHLPDYTGRSFTHDDWEEFYYSCEATTDVACVFGKYIIEAYPDAKVVLNIRDYDKWHKSMEDAVFSVLWSGVSNFSINYIEPIINSKGGIAARKMVLGLCHATTPEQARRTTRETYDRHNKEVRDATRPGQLLEYRMGQGWEPLCEFLGKPIPDVEFPWVNETAALHEKVREKIGRETWSAAKVLAPWVAGLSAMALTAWTVASKRPAMMGLASG